MRPPPKCTTPGQGNTWRGSHRWRQLLCSQAFDVTALRMNAAGVPVKYRFMVSAIASTLYEAAAFPGPSLDRRRIACLYEGPPIIRTKHFPHLIKSLHGALHCVPAVLTTKRQTISSPRCLPIWDVIHSTIPFERQQKRSNPQAVAANEYSHRFGR